eukprot:gene32873-39752_t
MAMEVVENVKGKINEFLAKYPQIDGPVSQVSDKIKVEKPFVVIGILAVPMILLLIWGNGDFAIDLVGFVYPAYASIKAIEAKDKDDEKLYLAYWLVFGLFKIFENLLDFMISSVPFFFLIKAAMLVYLYHPQTQGARLVYDNVVKVYVVPHLLGAEEDVVKEKKQD